MEIDTPHATIAVDGGSMRALVCRPADEGTLPAVIVIHEIYGLSDHIEDVAGRLARQGFVTLAPDLFWQLGAPPDFSDRTSFMRFRASMDDRQFLSSLDAAVGYLQHQPFVDSDRIGITGFCMGGYYALLETAHNPAIKACADFYGGPLVLPQTSETRPRSPLDAAHDITVPFLGLFGGEDQGIPVEQVRQLESILRENGVPAEAHVYPGAEHAFHNDQAPRYNEDAAKDAWRRTVAFFHECLKK